MSVLSHVEFLRTPLPPLLWVAWEADKLSWSPHRTKEHWSSCLCNRLQHNKPLPKWFDICNPRVNAWVMTRSKFSEGRVVNFCRPTEKKMQIAAVRAILNLRVRFTYMMSDNLCIFLPVFSFQSPGIFSADFPFAKWFLMKRRSHRRLILVSTKNLFLNHH